MPCSTSLHLPWLRGRPMWIGRCHQGAHRICHTWRCMREKGSTSPYNIHSSRVLIFALVSFQHGRVLVSALYILKPGSLPYQRGIPLKDTKVSESQSIRNGVCCRDSLPASLKQSQNILSLSSSGSASTCIDPHVR